MKVLILVTEFFTYGDFEIFIENEIPTFVKC